MSFSEILIKLIGLALAFVGFALLTSTVGLNILGIALAPVWAAILVGVLFLVAGIYIVRGGNFSF